MQPVRNQRAVENRVRDALKMDRARVQVGRISRFGLLEMSRQRLRPSLGETTSKVCPRCSGQGTIRGTKSIALSILRLVEEEAQKERSAEIRAVVPVSVATYLLNEKRKSISGIESRHSTRVTILPNTEMVTPHFDVVRLRDDEDTTAVSYKIDIANGEETDDDTDVTAELVALPKPAVQQVAPSQPAPEPPKKPGLIARLIKALGELFSDDDKNKNKKKGKSHGHQKKRNANTGTRNKKGRNKRDRDESQTESRNNKQQRDNNGKRDQRDQRDQNQNRNERRRRSRKKDENQRNDQAAAADSSNDNNQAAASSDKPAKRPSNRRGRPQERQRGPLPEVEAGLNESEDALDLNQPAAEAEADNAPSDASEDNNQREGSRRRRRGRGRRSDRKPEQNENETQTASDTKPEPTENEVAAQEETQPASVEVSTEASNEKLPENADAPDTKESTLDDALSELETVITEAKIEEREATGVTEPENAEQKLAEAAQQVAASTDDSAADEKTETADKPTLVVEPEATEAAAEKAEESVNEAATPVTKTAEAAQVEMELQPPAEETPALAEHEVTESAAAEPEVAAAESNNVTATEVTSAPESATRAFSRASNDPRYMPKPIENVLITTVDSDIRMGRPLDTSEPANIVHQPRDLQRPQNDPRRVRTAQVVVQEEDSAAES